MRTLIELSVCEDGGSAVRVLGAAPDAALGARLRVTAQLPSRTRPEPLRVAGQVREPPRLTVVLL